jgi:hypothetical protein
MRNSKRFFLVFATSFSLFFLYFIATQTTYLETEWVIVIALLAICLIALATFCYKNRKVLDGLSEHPSRSNIDILKKILFRSKT